MSEGQPTLAKQIRWSEIPADHLLKLIGLAKDEDIPPGQKDVTTETFPVEGNHSRAELIAREPLVLSGIQMVPLILEAYGGDAEFTAHAKDGQPVERGACLGSIEGNPATVLTSERILLNFLQHLSGIATLTRKFVQAMGSTKTRLLDTRKTTPGYRLLEKYAVTCGGGWNHRLGLHDRALIKDNHLLAIGAHDGDPLQKAVETARSQNPGIPVEVEVDNLRQLPHAAKAAPDCILLDNFTPGEIFKALKIINGAAATEASGGITLYTLPEFADLGLDFVSTGATVHQARWTDIGLDWTHS